jgi:hypothetical protein
MSENIERGQATPAAGPVAARAHTMRFQSAVNRVMRGLLATPLIGRGIGRKLVAVHVVGRKTGTRYVVPVAYTRHDGALLIGTPFGWARNLRTGSPVVIRLRGRLVLADVQVRTDEAGVVADYAIMAADNHAFASFNSIGLDADGTPNAQDLHLAWAAGARSIRLTPRAPSVGPTNGAPSVGPTNGAPSVGPTNGAPSV